MKLKNISIISTIFIFWIAGCVPSYTIRLYNNSQYTIDYKYTQFYPDTTLSFKRESVGGGLAPNSTTPFSYWDDPIDIWMEKYNIDTISFFIFDHDVVENYFWEEIQRDYKILQRYDLSLEDLKVLDYELTYPPSIKMRYMKMFPPFEE